MIRASNKARGNRTCWENNCHSSQNLSQVFLADDFKCFSNCRPQQVHKRKLSAKLFLHPYPLDWGGRGIYVRYILASKKPENMPITFFQAILGKMYCTYFEVSTVHFTSSSLKMYMVHFEVQPKDFREHQGIKWNMENDGIKWNMVEYGSCLKHFGSCMIWNL